MARKITVTRQRCETCGFEGAPLAVKVHDCHVQEMGGRCEDFPACGHTDGDGCQTRPEHTSEYYLANPRLMYEPGSPEWYDALDDEVDHDDEWDEGDAVDDEGGMSEFRYGSEPGDLIEEQFNDPRFV